MASTFLLLLHVYLFTDVCVVFRIPTGVTLGIHLKTFHLALRSVSLCLSLPCLCCMRDPQPLLSTIPLSPSLQKLPISRCEYSHS